MVGGADAVVTTVHPMGSDRRTQQRIGVEATRTFAPAARDAGVATLVHVSTAAVYDRAPGTGDVSRGGRLVGDDANDYSVTKRDTDAALAEVDGITRVLVRPPAILGAGETSVWNTLRPRASATTRPPPRRARRDLRLGSRRRPGHADRRRRDRAGRSGRRPRDAARWPVAAPPVNVAAGPATQRDYFETVTRALGVEPVWDDEPGWTGAIVADRAHAWGWTPTVTLDAALREIDAGLQN